MGKDYDGGISTEPLQTLLLQYSALQDALKEMIVAVAEEENQSSLVDQDKVKVTPGKCEAIKAKRKAVDDLIGSPSVPPGVAHALSKCSQDVVLLKQAVIKLKETYESVTTEPTGAPGHC